MSTTFEYLTFEDLDREGRSRLVELVDGELVEKNTASNAIWVVSQILMILKLFAESRKLGWVYAEMPIACFPWKKKKHARRPDVLFISRGKFPSAKTDIAAIEVAPELCVEVVSKHDDFIELETKIAEYEQAGVTAIWVVNPVLRTVRVHHANGSIQQFNADDTITAPDILPGFEAKVADFFPPA